MLALLGSGLAMENLPIARETAREIVGWHQAVGVAVLRCGLRREALAHTRSTRSAIDSTTCFGR